MGRLQTSRSRIRLALAVVIVLLASLVFTGPAFAHAELRQTSPARDSTVGGEFHSIAMQFTGLDPTGPQDAELFDPAGNLIESTLATEDQKLVIPIEPLTVPGQYTVNFSVTGIDGDFSQGTFVFRYEPGADEPLGITIDVSAPGGFDYVGFGLLLIAAAVAAFLVQRFVAALREHRAAQANS